MSHSFLVVKAEFTGVVILSVGLAATTVAFSQQMPLTTFWITPIICFIDD